MSDLVVYVAVFVALLIVDIIWTLYIRSLASGKAFRAGVLSALVYSVSAYSFIEIVKDTYLLAPAALGAFLGTYYTVKWDIKHEKKKISPCCE